MAMTLRVGWRVAALQRPLAKAAGMRSKHTLPDLPYDYNALEPVRVVLFVCSVTLATMRTSCTPFSTLLCFFLPLKDTLI